MKSVDYYDLGSALNPERLRFACNLSVLAWRKTGQSVLLLGTDFLENLEQQFWNFGADSFVPCARYGTEEASHAAVVLADEASLTAIDQGVAVVLDSKPPAAISSGSYERLCVVLASDEAQRQDMRVFYKSLKGQGIAPNYHKIPTK